MRLETSSWPAEMSKSFILWLKELLSIKSWWGISKLLLVFAKMSPREGCGAAGPPAEMLKSFIPSMEGTSPREGSRETECGSFGLSKSFTSAMKDVLPREGRCKASRRPAEMSKLFIPSMNDVWPAEIIEIVDLVHKGWIEKRSRILCFTSQPNRKHRYKHRSQTIPLDIGSVVAATSANTCRMSAVFETTRGCNTGVGGCEWPPDKAVSGAMWCPLEECLFVRQFCRDGF